MTTREARHAIYAAARAVDQYVPHHNSLKNDAFDILDEVLDEIRLAEAAQGVAA